MRWPWQKHETKAPGELRGAPSHYERPVESHAFEGARRRVDEGEETERGSELREREGDEPVPLHSDYLP
jgi:hypothetical protein